jgi:LCP family protein required for cell wall assembly
MTVMDVLPFGMMIALYVVLALLSLLIFVQIRKKSIKKWGKGLATVLAVLLVFLYGVGTAYAMGTLSFLSSTSVDNEKAVANITKDPFNVVITGMDVRGKIDEEGRSDVNMVVTVNPETAQILMTSIPRDYEIYMPDKDNAMDKLTHTGFYGVPTTILAEEQLLDMTANYYVKVNFTTVEKFIDAIGGVDVYSEYEFTPVKMKDWTVQEGMNHMNGEQALAFARERKAFPTGDRQRIINQQAVFEAMFKKATSSRTMLLSYNKILSNLKDYFEMSFSSRELRKLVKMQIAKDPDWQMYKNTIVGGDGTLDTYSAGYAYVMTQDEESISNARALIKAVMNGQPLEKDEDGVVHLVETESEEGTETEEE